MTTREEILDEVQDYNDKVGNQFNESIEDYYNKYKQGVIHHEEYIKQVALCCSQAKELLLPLPEVMESSLTIKD